LTKNTPNTLVNSTNLEIKSTSAPCEYSCNNGYRSVDAGAISITVPGTPDANVVNSETETKTTPSSSSCTLTGCTTTPQCPIP
jgi:hypothetical protein